MISLSLKKLHSAESELTGTRHDLENSTQHVSSKSTAVYFHLKIFNKNEGSFLQYSGKITVASLLIANQQNSYLFYPLAYFESAFSDCPTYAFMLLKATLRT